MTNRNDDTDWDLDFSEDAHDPFDALDDDTAGKPGVSAEQREMARFSQMNNEEYWYETEWDDLCRECS